MQAPDQTQPTSPKRLLTTAQGAKVILGGTSPEAYWGFSFDYFVTRLQEVMMKNIGNPAEAPWRRHIDFTTQDFLELENLVNGMDFVTNPAHLLDQPLATSFVRRCDLVGMHGGVNGIGVGKDTVANAIKPDGFIPMSFADTLKASLSMTYGLPMRFVTDRHLKEVPLPGTKFTPRRLMQLWGTEIGRSIQHDLWLKRHQLRVASAMHDLPRIAQEHPERISSTNGIRVSVPDVRFADEAAYVRDLGGFIAWISRPSLATVAAKLSNGHVSEAGIPTHPTDMSLVNEGAMEAFQARARAEILDRFTPAPSVAPRRPAPRVR
ncbi:deoxynucleotide monophosphate kinase family protein [Paucibacter soli]|uniref:deoxynucleotide monophosphate kinase family protein n=1 Tax=Paucibacter soli TaxID=3133433 RepID=UPI0030B3831F